MNCILILFAAAVFGPGAATIGTGLAQPSASGLHQWLEHRAVVVPVSPDRLVTGEASSQRYPSNPEGVACPLQWLPLFLASSSTISSAITCSEESYPSEVGWSLSCSDDTTLSGGAPYTSSVPLAVALGATCTRT